MGACGAQLGAGAAGGGGRSHGGSSGTAGEPSADKEQGIGGKGPMAGLVQQAACLAGVRVLWHSGTWGPLIQQGSQQQQGTVSEQKQGLEEPEQQGTSAAGPGCGDTHPKVRVFSVGDMPHDWLLPRWAVEVELHGCVGA